jgi:hypothetical protein
MSENRAKRDVAPVRESRNRGLESNKGRRWEKLRNSQEKKP